MQGSYMISYWPYSISKYNPNMKAKSKKNHMWSLYEIQFFMFDPIMKSKKS